MDKILIFLLFLFVAFVGMAKKEKREEHFFFNHKAHITAEEMECKDCHPAVEEGPFAKIVKLESCMECHSEKPETERELHPDEEKLRELYDEGKEIMWNISSYMPGHVYFNHKAHIVWGEMECKVCHGEIEKTEKPIERNTVGWLTMEKCIDCHRKEKASVDCLVCHK